MELQILTSESPGYMDRARNIVQLYSDSSFWNETLDLLNPELTKIICVEGDKGGVLIDSCTNGNLRSVMFAAFEEKNRRQGYLRACLEFGENAGFDIAVVQLNPTDNTKIWKNLGYKHLGIFRTCLCCTNRKFDFVRYKSVAELD